jgi:hypothetical protein
MLDSNQEHGDNCYLLRRTSGGKGNEGLKAQFKYLIEAITVITPTRSRKMAFFRMSNVRSVIYYHDPLGYVLHATHDAFQYPLVFQFSSVFTCRCLCTGGTLSGKCRSCPLIMHNVRTTFMRAQLKV